MIEVIGVNSDVPRHAYQTWPLFKKIRQEVRFLEIYKKVFNEDYKIIERPSGKTMMLIEKKDNK